VKREIHHGTPKWTKKLALYVGKHEMSEWLGNSNSDAVNFDKLTDN